MDKLDKLTARITYGISLISSLVTDETKLDRTTLRGLAKEADIESRTGLSYGFRDQCIDKVIWCWRSYRKLHTAWEKKVESVRDRLDFASDDKEKARAERYLDKVMKREPSKPSFQDKTPCRIDYRTGRIERSENSFVLWLHVSTLIRNQPMDIPLNPSYYHLKQLENAEINDFEIVLSMARNITLISPYQKRSLRSKQVLSGA